VRLLNLLNRTNYICWSMLHLADTLLVYWRAVYVCMYLCMQLFCSISTDMLHLFKNISVISSPNSTMCLTGL
jgi:hypothetical protein